MKMKLVLIIGSILMLTILGGIVMACSVQNKDKNYEITITKPETAIEIGKAILNEHFPQQHKYENTNFEAKEDDGVWIINNIISPPVANENGISVTVGGGYYVHIRKSNGEVLKIGVND